jgi:hypothetical protein
VKEMEKEKCKRERKKKKEKQKQQKERKKHITRIICMRISEHLRLEHEGFEK